MLTTREPLGLELEEEMTDAFLLKSEREGTGGGSGEGPVTSTRSMSTNEGDGGNREKGRNGVQGRG